MTPFSAFALFLAALQAGVVAPPPMETASAAPAPTLKAGTPVATRILETLSSRTARQGDRFRIAVLKDVLVDGLVVIPAGTPGYGEVRRVKEKGMMGKSGKLEIVPLFLELGGARIALDGVSRDKGGSNLAPVLLGWPLAGPAVAFVSGTDAVIPEGTELDAEIHMDLPLRPAG